LINSAPAVLDTLSELAAAISNDASFAATITTALAGKVAKSGDTMTGFLTLSADPAADLHAATKGYVDGLINAQMIYSTDDVLEGSLNLYYHTAAVRSDIGLASDNQSVLSYSSATGQFTYTHPTSDGILEGQTNKYYHTSAVRGDISLNSDDNAILSYSNVIGEFTFTTPDTDKIVEGSINQYFTTARARNSISNGSNINYDAATGIISTQAAVWSVNGQTGAVTLTTDDVTQGSTNLYFTNALAQGAISLTTNDNTILTYANGAFTFNKPNTDKVAEGTNNLYHTTGRARASISVAGWSNLSYDANSGVITVTAPTTDDVAEGSTNKYYTAGRVRNEFSATDAGGDGSFAYDSTTGVFTYTGPSAAEARAHFSATTNTGAQYDPATGVFSLSAIPNASLSNSDVTINNQTVALGGSTTLDTDDIGEGSTNEYFTQGRARSAISLTSNKASVLDYDATTGAFTFNLANQTTDDIAEGATNLYYQTARTRSDVSAIDAGGDGSFTYNQGTGEFTYTGPSALETRAHFSATTATGVTYNSTSGVIALSAIPNASLTNSDVTVNGQTVALGGSTTLDTDDIGEGANNLYYTQARFDSAFAAKDTDDLTEGSNLYYTQARFDTALAAKDTSDVAEDANATATSGTQYFTQSRARATLSGGTGVTYNSTSGVISIGQAVGTTDNVTFNNMTVAGDLTVQGTLTAIQSNTVEIADINLTLAKGAANAAVANNAGLTIDGANATITYLSGSDSWNFNKDVNINGGLSVTTSLSAPVFNGDLVGNVTGNVTGALTGNADTATALQTARTIQGVAFDGTGNITVVTAGTGVTVTGTAVAIGQAVGTSDSVTFAGVTAATFTGDLTGNVTGNVTGQVSSIANHDTSDLAEDPSATVTSGTMYFTEGRARNVVSANTNSGVTYNSTTGVIALSAIPNASLTNSSLTVNGTTISLGGTGSFSTASVSEDPSATTTSGTMYFTEGRARSAISLTTSDTTVLDYDAVTGAFTFNLSGLDTSEVAEDPAATTGSGTMYFTNTRARNAVSASDLGGDGSFSYDPTTGTFEYTGPSAAEARAHISATTASGVTYNSTSGVIALAAIPNSSLTNDSVTVNGQSVALGGSTTLDTDDIGEGATNEYFTQARARNAVSLTTSDPSVLSYNASTGAFTFSLAGIDTDEVQELPNAINQYFTTARARASVSNGSNINYDAATGVISTLAAVHSVNGQTGVAVLDTDDVSDVGATNKYFTQAAARGAIALTTDNPAILDYAPGTGDFTFVTPTTDAIAEGATNQYHTTARVDARIAAASVLDLADVTLDANNSLSDGYSLVYNAALQAFVAQNVTVTVTTMNFTGDGTTTSFNTQLPVNTINDVQVFINGLIQAPTYSFTINTVNDETSIVFDAAPEANDFIMVRLTPTAQLSAGGILNESSSIDGGTY
jgi:hypothetical protein